MSIPAPLPLGFDGTPTCCKRASSDVIELSWSREWAWDELFAFSDFHPIIGPPGLTQGRLKFALAYSNCAAVIQGFAPDWQMIATAAFGGIPANTETVAVQPGAGPVLGTLFITRAPTPFGYSKLAVVVLEAPCLFPLTYDVQIGAGLGQPQTPLSSSFAGEMVFALAWFQIRSFIAVTEMVNLSNHPPWLQNRWIFLRGFAGGGGINTQEWSALGLWGYWGICPPVLGLRIPTVINNVQYIGGIYVQPAPDLA